jgi:hypothetical protein
MKYIVILCLLSFSVLYTMDLVSLLDKNLNQESEIYFSKRFPSIKFSEIGQYYDQLPLDCRGKVILRMSENVLILHCVVMWLPQEIQRHIITYMFGGYKVAIQLKGDEDQTEEDQHNIEKIKIYNNKVDIAVEKFCEKKRLSKSVKLFYDIKRVIREDQPIAPMYAMNKADRNVLLAKLNVWYEDVVDPFMNTEEREWVDELSEDERVYFTNKSINKCPGRSEHAFICCMSSMGAIFLASIATFGCGLGSLCCGINYKVMPWCMGGVYAGGLCGGCAIGICCLYRSETKKEIL